MADKKLTKAQQAAEPKKKKRMTVEEQPRKEHGKSAPAAAEPEKKDPRAVLQGDAAFPLRYVFAVVCAVVLLIFVSVLFSEEGIILHGTVAVFSGLFGKNAYYAAIPALVYLIWIQLASRNQLVRRRSFCIMALVLLYGGLSHLISAPPLTCTGLDLVAELYETGKSGLSGGVICGFLMEILTKGFGGFFTLCTMLTLAARR